MRWDIEKKLLWVMTVLAILVAGYAIVQYYVIGPDKATLVSEKLEEQTLNWIWYGILYFHVAGSIIALVLGSFNLLRKSLRDRRPQLHRLLGRCYVAGVVVGGLTGVYLAFQATGGLVSTLGFLSLVIGWLGSVYMAVKTIRAKRSDLHRKWMIRNYGLTLAAVMLRLWLGIFIFAFGGRTSSLAIRLLPGYVGYRTRSSRSGIFGDEGVLRWKVQ